MGLLEGKTALITGSARGIGQAIAVLFAQEGANVVIADVNDAEGESTAKAIGQSAFYHHLDVSLENEWETIIDSIKSRFGKLSILVNNSAIRCSSSESGTIEGMSLETWKKIHSVNLDGVFLGCKHSLKLMKNSGSGSIINVSSIVGIKPFTMDVAYGSSKGAIRELTKSIALHCTEKNYNIRCNSIHPGFIDTKILGKYHTNKILHRFFLTFVKKKVPLKRIGNPNDISQLALFLASDQSSYITGSELLIDGGLSLI